MSDNKKNAKEVLAVVNGLIEELEALNAKAKEDWVSTRDFDGHRFYRQGWTPKKQRFMYKMDAVFDECSIFDWWTETLSLSQLKQMRAFLNTAISLGFDGYVCFKVGAKYCAHGMWAHKEESKDGYSPDGDVLFHSFRSGDNYWSGCINGIWLHDKYPSKDHCAEFTLKDIKAELNGIGAKDDIHGYKEAVAI